MHDPLAPKLPPVPFFIGGGLLLALAFFIAFQSSLPMGRLEILACLVCSLTGAALAVSPFLIEYRAMLRLTESDRLASAVSTLRTLDGLTTQIRSSTHQWADAQEAAERTATLAKGVADRMTAEIRNFNEFLQRAADGEKGALRLETEKLRRAENDWVQVVMRIFDHVYALHQAAVRSGQPAVIDQIGQFQNACRDAARRVGLAPFVAAASEPFDAERHTLVNGEIKPSDGAAVAETIATGFTFRGTLLRPALVRLHREPDQLPV